jgi:hypothetical protein
MFLHAVLKAFADARKHTKGYSNCKVHLSHFFKLPNVKFSDLTEEQVQGVIDARLKEGASHNTVVVREPWGAVSVARAGADRLQRPCERARFQAPVAAFEESTQGRHARDRELRLRHLPTALADSAQCWAGLEDKFAPGPAPGA